MLKRKQKVLVYALILFFLYQYLVLTQRSSITNLVIANTPITITTSTVVRIDRPKVQYEEFCVVVAVFNPASYTTRYASYRHFENHIKTFGVQLITVELAIGNQSFAVTEENNPNHIQLRSNDVLWYKENLLNIGIRRSPAECEYISWIDVEVEFTDKDWVHKSIVALNAYKIIQPFDEIAILGPKRKPSEIRKSFARCYVDNVSYIHPPHMQELYEKYNITYVERENHYCATGFAWVSRKSTLLEVGGLYDKGIVGAGDYITIQSFLGHMDSNNSAMVMNEFLDDVLAYQEKSSKIIDGRFGYISGALSHTFHGSKRDRGYATRTEIFLNPELPYNPKQHMFYDDNGILHFQPEVRDHFVSQISTFFFNRKEDYNRLW